MQNDRLFIKTLSTCDACRLRKIRCIKLQPSDDACTHCQARRIDCLFSPTKRRKSRMRTINNDPLIAAASWTEVPRTTAIQLQTPPETSVRAHASSDLICHGPSSSQNESPAVPMGPNQHHNNQSDVPPGTNDPTELNQGVSFQHNNVYITSSSLAFFSEHKLSTLAHKLGHDRVRGLVGEMQTDTRKRQAASMLSQVELQSIDASHLLDNYDQESRQIYLKTFFEEIHPVYPFLDPRKFDTDNTDSCLQETLRKDPASTVLYLTVLALGILHRDGGSFEPAQGPAWTVFSTVLRVFPRLLFERKSLLVAQALTAMAIFAMNYSGWPVEELLITEAARLALALQLNKTPHSTLDCEERRRTFWVIYCIEKEYCFHSTQSSVFDDCDISCPIPSIARTEEITVDWLTTQVALCRILSHASTRLFSSTAFFESDESCSQAIDRTTNDLDQWLLTIPKRYRPGSPLRGRDLTGSGTTYAVLQIHFLYYTLQIVLSRLLIHAYKDRRCAAVAAKKSTLLDVSRRIIEATHLIPLEASTPMNIIGLTPVVATFILFDLVVYNPTHSETKKNLMYLDIGAGFFHRHEVVSGGVCRTSKMGCFAQIARDFVNEQSLRRMPEASHDLDAVQSTRQANEKDKALPDIISDRTMDATVVRGPDLPIEHECRSQQSLYEDRDTVGPAAFTDTGLGPEVDTEFLYYPVMDSFSNFDTGDHMMANMFDASGLFTGFYSVPGLK